MEKGEFRIVDVFSTGKYTGNQLAVVMAPEGMTDSRMQAVALEMNYSETTFITGGSAEDGFDVRIYTPTTEVPFAGHPVLGTAFVLATEFCIGEPEALNLRLKCGTIHVTIEYKNKNPQLLTMRQNTPVFGPVHNKDLFANLLGLEEEDLDEKHLPQAVSTGLPFFIVPVKCIDSINKIKLNGSVYEALISGSETKAVLVFCMGARDSRHDLHVRMFAPFYGIQEDPATGSGCGCLAAYLLNNQVLEGESISVLAEQGHMLGRPSLLRLGAWWDGEDIAVTVGGEAVLTAKGMLL
jgi:trans-2,3-dihydro-3-hydroxyanthranilate isomerase